MYFLNWFLFLFSCLLFGIGLFIILTCFIGTIRFSDYFIRLHAIKISNIYGITFILLSLAVTSYNLIKFIQIFLVIIINLLSNLAIFHTVTRIFLINDRESSSISRRKYNEMMSKNSDQEDLEENIPSDEVNDEEETDENILDESDNNQ